MTAVIVEVGPETVRGPNDVKAEWVSTALECIDDDIALIDEYPVAVSDVWREVLETAVGGCVDGVVLVCPTWWASSRIELVCDAARRVATNVVDVRRADVLSDGFSAVVEITREFVVVSRPGASVVVVMNSDGPAAVASEVGASGAAVVDAPVGVDGADTAAVAIAERLRAHGVSVSIAGRDLVRRAALMSREQEQDTEVDDGPPISRNHRGIAVLAGAALCVAGLCAGFTVRDDKLGPSSVDMPMTLLVEGRVGVKVPVRWTVQRITTGPGSARVQVVSPSNADIVLHITQSSIPSHLTLATVAGMLRTALADEPDGVFVEFNAADHRAGKPAVTYRENRAGHQVVWTVLIDDEVRIAIGCQSGPGREPLIHDVCDQAIRSAHAVF
jgi:type VII secretion-associated protein (TIGR03931 family)